jgi:hypothetical protein
LDLCGAQPPLEFPELPDIGAASYSGGIRWHSGAQRDILSYMADHSLRDVGGTPGGLGSFVIGLILACLGGYLLTNQVMVTSSYWNLYGTNTFGITLLPMLIGVAMLFWNGRSVLGWLLTVAGGLFILAGVIANLHIYFAPTSLFNTIVMLVLLVGGLTLIARAMRAA